MSMIGCFYSLRDEDLEDVVRKPARFRVLGHPDDAAADNKDDSNLSFFGRIFGDSKNATERNGLAWKPLEAPAAFDVDKAWHGIHYLLTRSYWDGEGPLAFVLQGGREIAEDCGYGPPHGFTSKEVKEIAKALETVDVDKLYEEADPGIFAAEEIYPTVWDQEPKEECIGYVTEYLKSLKEFVAKTAESDKALIVFLN